MIYLDYAANTPVDEEVLNTFCKATKKYIANPNSSHKIGVEAKNKIDECSKNIAKYFDCDSESVIYTSGSSESNNLVIKGICLKNQNKGKHIIISALEHSSVVAPCNYLTTLGFDVSVIPITKEGLVDLEELKKELTDQTILVSICSVDSELGTIQPIEEIGTILKDYPNCVFHTDATQAIGKTEIDFSKVDFITFAPHKFYGLNGFGCLINRHNVKLVPLIHGGKSTTIYRSGTPATPLIVSLAKALRLAIENIDSNYEYVKKLSDYTKEQLSKINTISINNTDNSIPHIINISVNGIKPETLLHALEQEEIYISTKTACSKGDDISESVYELTKDKEKASHSLRISISHITTKEEIDYFLKKIEEKIINLQQLTK